MLLIILLIIPLIGALALFLMRNRSLNIPLISSALVLLGSFGLKNILYGKTLTYRIPLTGPFMLNFSLDSLSLIFVWLTAFLWLAVSIYSPKYMGDDGAWSFQLSTLLTLFTVMGIFLAGDLLTMLLFFELMTLSSYFWVIHYWDKDAIKAGYFYLFFSIFGGLLLALGIVFMGGSTDVLPLIGSGAVNYLNPKLFLWSIAIFIVGFGIKAGMVPLHLWLPHAHSVAPTPGSALLSGLLIKVGAYGLIRVAGFVGWGLELGSEMIWLGPVLIILGASTMLLGVTSALIQANAKKLLAYHSISQMGYIILGLGIGLYLGPNGGFGLAGAIYHIINHALFKVALFLGVGIIYIHTGENDLYRLGGLWRRFPITAILMLLAVLGITGAPGLNGYASKSLLHHGISLAAETGGTWLIWVERLFSVVGIGTAASFSKLYYLIFLGKSKGLEVKDGKSPILHIAMVPLIILMLAIGIKPAFLLNSAIIPAVRTLGIEGITTSLANLSFWSPKDIIDMMITLILGIVACWAGFKTGVFHWQLPVWLTIEGMVMIIGKRFSALWQWILGLYHSMIKSVGHIYRISNFPFILNSNQFQQEKAIVLYGIKLIDINADIAMLVLTLGFLIAWYIPISSILFRP